MALQATLFICDYSHYQLYILNEIIVDDVILCGIISNIIFGLSIIIFGLGYHEPNYLDGIMADIILF